MPKVYVRWGRAPRVPRLTSSQKKKLKEKINKKAEKTNAFLITISRPEYHWLKTNLANAVMEVMMRHGHSGSRMWVAIGADRESVAIAKQEVRP